MMEIVTENTLYYTAIEIINIMLLCSIIEFMDKLSFSYSWTSSGLRKI